MKKLMFFILMLFSIQTFSQVLYEKYNEYKNRYEFFNTYGEMIGVKKYDPYTKTWAYYRVNSSSNDLNLTETAKYIGSVQAQLQAKYDYNLTRLTNSIEALYNKVKVSTYSNYVKNSSYDEFAKCIKILDGKNLNMTDTSQVSQAIIWLNKSMDNIINFYLNKEN